jgi:putative DNA primase/helicase
MRAFFDALWPKAIEGNLTFWFFPSKKSAHLSLAALKELTDEDLEDLHRDNRAGAHIYFGLGLRRPGLTSSKQGGKQDIVALPGFALDIDIHHPTAHVAKNLPRTDEEAYEIIANALEPTIIVHTGHGWHVYWLFKKPLLLTTATQRTQAQKAYKAFQQPFIDRAAKLGWHLDNTASIQRVWRVPGFINPKSTNPVKLVHSEL